MTFNRPRHRRRYRLFFREQANAIQVSPGRVIVQLSMLWGQPRPSIEDDSRTSSASKELKNRVRVRGLRFEEMIGPGLHDPIRQNEAIS